MDAPLSRPQFLFSPPQRQASIIAKLAALLEVIAVIGASIMAVMMLGSMISPSLAETLGFTGEAVDFLAASGAMAKQFGMQYGVVLALALIFAFTRGRTSLRAYALTTQPLGLPRLLLLGVIAGFIISIPTQSIFLAKEIWPLGQDTPLWRVMENNPWDRDFWIFAGVASFALVPIIEELTWRSYALGRMTEAFHPGAALFTVTLSFALLHTQYLAGGDFLGYATLVSLIFIAFSLGLITLTTGSVLPAVIAHAIVNIPMSFEIGAGRLALGVVLLAVFIKPALRYGALMARSLFNWDTFIAMLLVTAIGGATFALVSRGASPLHIFAGATVLSATLGFVTKSAWRS